MNSVNTNNNLSFQAKLKVSVPVSDKARLKKIQAMFEEKTQNYLGDTLHVSMNPDKDFEANQIHHLGFDKPKKYHYPAHIMPDFEELMTKLDDNALVKKLVKIFKSLRAEQDYNYIEDNLTESINSTAKTIKQNKIHLNRYKKLGKDDYAKTYEELIARGEKRLEALNAQQMEEETKLANKLEKITAGDEDLEHIPSIYNIYQG